jgi:uncharacterized damage-inducible protein DinB
MTRLGMLIVTAGALCAQDAIVADAKMQWNIAKGNVLKAAKKVAEDKYSYKASPEVRTFGGFIGHITDSNYMFCGMVSGEKKAVGAEKSMTKKDDLVKALEESIAFCDKAYELGGEAAVEKVKFFGAERTKVGVLFFNNMHTYEHYGNLVTYMRANGIVPPSSEGR